MTSRVLVALRIRAPQRRVFEAFTEEIDRWWRPNGLFQMGRRPGGRLMIEPGVGGRLTVTHDDGTVDEVGRVVQWDPPRSLVLAWHPASFAADQTTEVHVRFEFIDDTTTRIVVEHFGWDTIPPQHAARHGFPLGHFQQRLGEWWQQLLASLDEHTSTGD